MKKAKELKKEKELRQEKKRKLEKELEPYSGPITRSKSGSSKKIEKSIPVKNQSIPVDERYTWFCPDEIDSLSRLSLVQILQKSKASSHPLMKCILFIDPSSRKKSAFFIIDESARKCGFKYHIPCFADNQGIVTVTIDGSPVLQWRGDLEKMNDITQFKNYISQLLLNEMSNVCILFESKTNREDFHKIKTSHQIINLEDIYKCGEDYYNDRRKNYKDFRVVVMEKLENYCKRCASNQIQCGLIFSPSFKENELQFIQGIIKRNFRNQLTAEILGNTSNSKFLLVKFKYKAHTEVMRKLMVAEECAEYKIHGPQTYNAESIMK